MTEATATRRPRRTRGCLTALAVEMVIVLLIGLGLTRIYRVPSVVGKTWLHGGLEVRFARFDVHSVEAGAPHCPQVITAQDPPAGTIRLLVAGAVTLVISPPEVQCRPYFPPVRPPGLEDLELTPKPPPPV